MLGVIWDEKNTSFNGYSDIECIGGLKIYGEDLLNIQIKELKSVGIENIIVFTDNKNMPNNKNVVLVKDYSELLESIFSFNDNIVVLVRLNSYFEFKNISKNTRCCGDIVDNIGSKCGILISKSEFNSESSINELFYKSYAQKFNLVSYFKSLSSVGQFKELLNDIIENKTNFYLPKVAEGIYTYANVPKGEFTVIPPVFIGDSVQIEKDAVIGPNAIIMNNSLISTCTRIKNSVICENCYVSSDCFLDDCICCKNVSIRRKSGIFRGSVIGENSLIGEDIFLDSRTLIKKQGYVSKTKCKIIDDSLNAMALKNKFYNLTSDKVSLLGRAVSYLFNSPKIAVLRDSSMISQASKISLIGSLMGNGCECYDFGSGFKSQIYFYMKYCELDCGIFLENYNGYTLIFIVHKDGSPISKCEYLELLNEMENPKISFEEGRCLPVRQIKGMKSIYLKSLKGNGVYRLNFNPVFICKNDYITSFCLKALICFEYKNYTEELIFNIDEYGEKLKIIFKSITYTNDEILEFINFYSHLDDESLNNRNDALSMAFCVMRIISNGNLSFDSAFKKINLKSQKECVCEYKKSFAEVLSKLSDLSEIDYENEQIYVRDYDVKIEKIDDKDIKKLRIFAKGKNAEAAQEVIDNITNIIKA